MCLRGHVLSVDGHAPYATAQPLLDRRRNEPHGRRRDVRAGHRPRGRGVHDRRGDGARLPQVVLEPWLVASGGRAGRGGLGSMSGRRRRREEGNGMADLGELVNAWSEGGSQ